MNNILDIISIGELIDKLSILSIKKEYIKDDNKLLEVNKEYDILYNIVKNIIDTNTFLYNVLIQINKDIWHSMDKIREIDEINNSQLWIQECKKTIIDNDRRFRIKNKINIIFNSSIKEQKSYKKKKLFLITHNELGDIVNHCGMIRYFSTLYDEVKIVCRNDYLTQLEYMFEDDKSISFYAKNRYAYNETNILSEKENISIEKEYTILRLGAHNPQLNNIQRNFSIVPYNFYENAKIPYNIYWNYFYFRETKKSLELYNILKNNNIDKYMFIHTTAANRYIFNYNYIEHKLNINKDDILIICSDYNIYDKGHKFYDIANYFIMQYILDYYTTIKYASYVILTDSCIFCLAIHIPILTDNCYYVNNRGSLLYSTYLYNEKYGFNTMKSLRKFKML
jgi:hypothetical protein